MKTKILLTILFNTATFIFAGAQTADEIVNNNIKAMGGKEKIANLKTLKMTGSMDLGPDMKAPFTIYLKEGVKFRFEMELQGMKMVQALEGDSGWSINPFGGKTDPERMSAEEIKVSKDQADFNGPLYDYKAKGNAVEYLGKEDMEGTDTYKLKVTKKNGDVSYIYLDTSTYLELKQTTKHKFNDKEVEGISLNSNYKNIDGLMFAFSMEERGGEEITQGQVLNLTSIDVNPKLDDSLFKMPLPGAATGEKK